MTATATTARPIRDADELVRRHRGHFFDPATMRGFGSRLLDVVCPAAGGGRSYFVTSERDRFDSAWGGQRRYTVRAMSWATGDIDEPDADAFGAYTSRARAVTRARTAAREDTVGAAGLPCPLYTHRTYSQPVTHRGRQYCGACVDDAARMLHADYRRPTSGPVTRTAALAALR